MSLRCRVYGDNPIEFRWVFKGENVSFAQTISFTLNEKTEGVYRCKVTFLDGYIIMSSDCSVKRHTVARNEDIANELLKLSF